MSYERPPEPGHTPDDLRVFYWAELTREDGDTTVAVLSPEYDVERDVWNWIEDHQHPNDLVYAARRMVRPSGYYDEPLIAAPPTPQHERLHELLNDARVALTGGGRRVPDRAAHTPSTDVTESQLEREQTMRAVEGLRAQRQSEQRGSGVDATDPMLGYADVYDEHGQPRAEYVEIVEAMRAALRNIGAER